MAASQQALLQQLLAQSQQQSQRAPQVEFKCGKMNKADGATTVTPDLRKGKLTVKADQDQLMHVIWTNREQGIQEDDMIIFPGDATFEYVEQARNNKTNNRVYALKFTSTPKKVHFYWMQEPASAAEKDKELAEKVNALINGETPAAGGAGQIDQHGLMAMLTQAHASVSSPAADVDASVPSAEDSAAAANTGTAATSEGGADSSAGSAQAGEGASGAGEAEAGGGGNAEAGDSDQMNVDEEKKS